jgi:hypothetical protein
VKTTVIPSLMEEALIGIFQNAFEVWARMVYIPAIKGVSGTNKLTLSKGLQQI